MFFLLAPFLGDNPTTSASILAEFGGDDWAAGCGVAHVFSHMYVSKEKRKKGVRAGDYMLELL